MPEDALYLFDESTFSIQDSDLQIFFSEPPLSCTVKTTTRGNGTVLLKSTYRENVLHGPSFAYYADGTRATEKWFYNGVGHGRSLEYSTKGALLAQHGYVHGRLAGRYLRWYPSGQLQLSGAFVNGMPTGLFELFHYDGGIIRSTRFTEGRRDGYDVGWTDDGYLLFCELWRAGAKERIILEDVMSRGLGIR